MSGRRETVQLPPQPCSGLRCGCWAVALQTQGSQGDPEGELQFHLHCQQALHCCGAPLAPVYLLSSMCSGQCRVAAIEGSPFSAADPSKRV